ncbi:LysR family transcriptional regulator [Klebsiella quasipneumoniae]|uniref:LysR family transcriptional regulator n=1 Tax=Klebsiella quasipneumoniae TaxID=1463165 RepID=UPI000D36EBC6|nr:LysR family transcriptional regulator [Klebsiella quasipneumoniae]MDE4832961.1 LysR family transcriptional regulator [Klebsiella quasipneumoniae subsp. similipneumoniae]PUH04306.1 LysR family transcriptional regulator [Klebsiella quasipneumoniae]HBV2088642.1 LysR family transcriptional regulator [Klebsiella quasipneumoniae]
MRIFIRVVERGSMSAAARDLGIGQPAVSERIEKLEAHLGTRLLRRNTRNMSLTHSGNVFYERSKTAVQAAEHALSVNEENQGLQGKIRIAAPYSAGESLLMPALLQLQNEHPELQVDVIFNDRIIDPVTEGVDLSLRVLVASPALLAKMGHPDTPEALTDYPFAAVSGVFASNRIQLIASEDQLINVPVNIQFQSTHWRSVLSWLLAGHAIGVLQSPVCRKEMEHGALIPLLSHYPIPPFSAWLLHPPAGMMSYETRICASLLEGYLRDLLLESK